MPIKDFYTLSDNAIEQELGGRIKTLRLRKNITQQTLADDSTLSLNTIKSLEAGRGKLSSLIAVLRELGALDDLNHFIPEPSVSPMQLVRMKGQLRERASGERLKKRPQGESDW